MAKTLKDIIVPRAGRNVPKGEEDFLGAHEVDEKDYPVKQKTDKLPHTPTTSHKPDDKHGYTADKESEKVYTKTNKKSGVSESSDDVEELKNRIKKIASKRAGTVTPDEEDEIVKASQKLRSMKKEEVEQVDEVLKKSDPAGKWVKDFVHSDNPKFEGKSKKKRMQMALAAYYDKQKKG